MKVGKNDKKAFLLFTPEELAFLQDNVWQMADAFGLDDRISNLKGVKPAGFYQWDLECLHDVTDGEKAKAPIEDREMIDNLLKKLSKAMKLT